MTLLKSQAGKKRGGARPSVDVLDLPGDGKPHPGRRMTEKEFADWVDAKTRAEWVDGEVIIMPPDSDEHDDFCYWLRSLLQRFVEHHGLGRVKGPNFTIRLPRQRQRRVPDVLFVSKERASLIRPTFVQGAPDLILEIVSPESVSRDWRDKYLAYQRAGVREYWVIDRNNSRVEAYVLGGSGRFQQIKERDGKLESTVIKGLYLRVAWLLGPGFPSVRSVLKELGVKD